MRPELEWFWGWRELQLQDSDREDKHLDASCAKAT
nr:MAG TPA_asm: hypothetical protein [Bacteriophage sp.]DAT97301.1 MAG TPA: hypothetical protein [Caudoviricetes sp.]DAZ24527.1 MAG TPA: hypothetical protein [Caudoviricetes sp.]